MRKYLKIAIVAAFLLGLSQISCTFAQANSTWHKGTPTALRGNWRRRDYEYSGKRGHWETTYAKISKNRASFFRYGTDTLGLKNVHYQKIGSNLYKLQGIGLWGWPSHKQTMYLNKLSKNKILSGNQIFYRWSGHFRFNPKTHRPVW